MISIPACQNKEVKIVKGMRVDITEKNDTRGLVICAPAYAGVVKLNQCIFKPEWNRFKVAMD